MRSALITLLFTTALAVAACGSDGTTETSSASPGEARAHAGKTREALAQALAQVRAGDRKAAEDTVAEGYLQHFEEVEGPLDKVDHELNERLEDQLKADLREKIRDGAPVAEVKRLVASLDADLATAEQKLK